MLENQSVANLEDEIEVEGSILNSLRDTVDQLENTQGSKNFNQLQDLSHEKESLTQDLEGLEKRLDLLPQNSSTMANEIQSSLNELREELRRTTRRDFLDSE